MGHGKIFLANFFDLVLKGFSWTAYEEWVTAAAERGNLCRLDRDFT
jgi:hypothetical protein